MSFDSSIQKSYKVEYTLDQLKIIPEILVLYNARALNLISSASSDNFLS